MAARTMLTMDPVVYSVLHVAAAFVLVASNFSAFANPVPERRGLVLAVNGIAALVAVVAGFGLHAKLGVEGFPGWLVVKLVAWLVLAGTTGMAFRKPGLASALALVSAIAVIGAVYCVYTKPF